MSALSLIIDIQSNVVNGALVDLKDRSMPKVVYFSSDPLLFVESAGADYVIKMTIQTIEDVVSRVMKEGLRKNGASSVEDVHYILSSPWVMSKSKNANVHFDVDTEITPKIIQDIIDKEKAELAKNYETDLLFLEQKIFDIRLNGYPVQSYKKKKVKDIEISFALTLSSDKIIKRISSAVSKHYHINKEIFHSALLLHYISVRSAVGSADEYIILHTHGELTDIVIVKKGFSSYFASFPFGTTTLGRKLAMVMKGNYETAESSLCLCNEGRLEESQKKKIEDMVAPIMSEWQKECLQFFSYIGKDVVLPRRIYLSSPTHFDLFKKTLQNSGFEISSFDKPLMEMYILALQDMI